jgi:hypothetical protein
MNRVDRDVHISTPEVDVDDDKVVDMVEMISDLLLGDLASYAAHDNIPRGASCNLTGNMLGHMELAVGPAEFELALS